MNFIFGLICLVSISFAQNEDEILEAYVNHFSIKALPQLPAPKSQLYQLGLKLFHEKQLSGKGNITCHACHAIAAFSGDNLPLAVGEGARGIGLNRQQDQGPILGRHTPPLYNLGYPDVQNLFWDGRVSRHYSGGWITPEDGLNGARPALFTIAKTLDSLLAVQSLFPMATPDEMLGVDSKLSRLQAWDAIMDRLLKGERAEEYQRLFKAAYPKVQYFNIGHVANALAEWQRHNFLANNTLWDQYLRGNKNILSLRMKRGAILFHDRGGCFNCHTGPHLTTWGHQNILIPQVGPGVKDGDDLGRGQYQFRISPLRNVALTSPYMHSGVFKNMWEVIEHYNQPIPSLHHFNWNPKHSQYREDLILDQRLTTMMNRTNRISSMLPKNLNLTQTDKEDLYCFLMVALTDDKLQTYLNKKGVMDEITDCSPRIRERH